MKSSSCLLLMLGLASMGIQGRAEAVKLKKVNHFFRISNLKSFPKFRVFVFYPQSVIDQNGDEITFDASGSVIRKKAIPFEWMEDGLVYSLGDILYAPHPLMLSEDSLLAIWRRIEGSKENIEEVKKEFQNEVQFLREPLVQATLIDSLDEENPAIAVSDVFELQWNTQVNTFQLALLTRQYEFEGGASRIAEELETESIRKAMGDAAKRKMKRPTETIFSDRNGKRKAVKNINGIQVIEIVDEPEPSSLLYFAMIFPVVFGFLGWFVFVGRKKWIERKRGDI